MAAPGLRSRQLRRLLPLLLRPRALSCCCPRRRFASSTPGRLVPRGPPRTLQESPGPAAGFGIAALVRGLGSRGLATEATWDAERKSSSVNPHELAKFQALAHTWWDERGELGPLHSLNSLRVPLIRDGLLGAEAPTRGALPLKGFHILDVGCGGGLLCEPLARIGATVLGIDPLEENVGTARVHARSDPQLASRLRYEVAQVEDLAEREGPVFDAVVASEVVEHVHDPAAFIACCCRLVKPGGSLFLTTINKTAASFAFAIVVAEWLLRIVPRGTHAWESFVEPRSVRSALEENGLSVVELRGMAYSPLRSSWSWSDSTDVNYAVHALK
ncbi:ubiquinone biosynthesis O-methyltransferase, mitochondrial [Petromyzon marinus]|uniref:ubiquinone biosynthesis O-methyltransferase, mitochondrial n=1 Tax=Petromyzon marinus TaxID=7757 RepID=UPI003F71BE36